MPRPLFFIGSLLLFPSLLAAQLHGVMPAPASRPAATMPLSTPPRSVSRPPAAAPVLRLPAAPRLPNQAIGSRNRPIPAAPRTRQSHVQVSPGPFDQGTDFPVPGLGFDAVHFAATHPEATKHRGPDSGFIIPLFGGGYYVPYPVPSEDVAQPAIEQVEQVPDGARETSPPARSVVPPAMPSVPAPEVIAEPHHDNEEYVFVRRDGTVFFALAYSWDRRILRYITRQGLRQTLSSEALDLEATRQFNEQRGLSFLSPI
jgi:hypothetical protein